MPDLAIIGSLELEFVSDVDASLRIIDSGLSPLRIVAEQAGRDIAVWLKTEKHQPS